MTDIRHTKNLILGFLLLWTSTTLARGKGRISVWGWIKLVWKNRSILSKFQLAEIKEEALDLTGPELDEIRDLILTGIGWTPTDDNRDRAAVVFKAIRDNILTLILLKNTISPPKPQILP